MKPNAFDFPFRQTRLLMLFTSTVFVFVAVSHATAQPGGCYD